MCQQDHRRNPTETKLSEDSDDLHASGTLTPHIGDCAYAREQSLGRQSHCHGKLALLNNFKVFSRGHSDMDSKSFVRLCRQFGLIDNSFTALDAHLAFSSAVPVSKSRIDFASFELALKEVACKKGSSPNVVRRVVSMNDPSVKARGSSSSASAPCYGSLRPHMLSEA